MRLSELCAGVVETPLDLQIAEVREDSRAVGPGDLFVAVRGQTVDGHEYLRVAAERGAAAAVVERAVSREMFAGPQLVVPSSAKALARIAANRYGRPADAMTLIGVTGTNGKTTTTFLAEALARAAGGEPGVIGTVSYRWKGVRREALFTTPTALGLHAILSEMRQAGVTHVAMECSSHALALDRLEGVRFQVAAFTNLTQDHLDFHRTMEAYRDAKARLFAEHLREGGAGVVNLDGAGGAEMLRAVAGRAITVSARERADVWVRSWRQDVGGIVAEVEAGGERAELRSPLIGAFNVENLGVAVGIGLGLGLGLGQIVAALGGVTGAPGRLERVANGLGVGVFVDYAHTPDALERVMAAVRPLVTGRLIVVFGCGGDRDRTKRPRMGRAVARDADLAVVTSDNPRTEDPRAIVDMILEGTREIGRPVLAIVDRREAIGAAIAEARPGDVVLIAGKGHEDYQIVGKVKHHFDDREEAASALQKVASDRGFGHS